MTQEPVGLTRSLGRSEKTRAFMKAFGEGGESCEPFEVRGHQQNALRGERRSERLMIERFCTCEIARHARQPGSGVDIYMGSGGAPEGVLAAAALRCLGGFMQGRLLFRNEDEKARAVRWGVQDLGRKYGLEDLARGDVIFAATGVTDGAMLKGVRRFAGGASTHSIIMRSKTGTVRRIEATHDFTRKGGYR